MAFKQDWNPKVDKKKHLTYLHFFLQFTLDKYYNKILQLFYFCKKTLLDEVQASEARGTISYSVWHEKQNIFFFCIFLEICIV